MSSMTEGERGLPAEASAPVPAAVVRLGPGEPFDAFYHREMPGLVALARALGGPAAAEDIAQEAMLAAYRRWSEVASFDSPAAWVRRVCANQATSALRRRAVEARALLRLSRQRPPAVELDPLHETFWDAVRRLPARQAQVAALRYVYDLSVADIAATLGCSEGSVKVHLSRGRSRIAERITGTGEVR
jgi:RNA polymerase sigma-70 factor (ECF subfamily)